MISLLSNFTIHQCESYCPFTQYVSSCSYQNTIVHYTFHHAATQNPGHGTKFVTLPSPVLLY